jgi:hypothetical protein
MKLKIPKSPHLFAFLSLQIIKLTAHKIQRLQKINQNLPEYRNVKNLSLVKVRECYKLLLPLTLPGNIVPQLRLITTQGALFVLQRLQQELTLIANIALQLGHIITRGALYALALRSLRHHPLLPL